jgi:hypothetical protein
MKMAVMAVMEWALAIAMTAMRMRRVRLGP